MPLRYAIQKAERFFVYNVLHVDDTPHRIALGVAIGIFVSWTPTMGLHMILTVLLATLLRANKVVGLPFVWISNPLTAWPIYFEINYHLGKVLLGSPNLDLHRLKGLFLQGSWWEAVRSLWTDFSSALAPLWVGSLVAGIVLAAATYLFILKAVIGYRKTRQRLRTGLHRRRHLTKADTSDAD